MSVSEKHESSPHTDTTAPAAPAVAVDDGAIDPDPEELAFKTRNTAATVRAGAFLGELLQSGDTVLLQGGLGAGKTAFTQGIGRGLGVPGTINSPTFTILKEYAGRIPLYHFDLYRLEEPDELLMLGFEDYFGGAGVCVVEWPEKADGDASSAYLAPWADNYLRVALRRLEPGQRSLSFAAHGQRGGALLIEFKRIAVMNGMA
jgi:tRNA threonylcarbamoyladenosine biosynthesis protein TsaE